MSRSAGGRREVLLVTHTGRPAAVTAARALAAALRDAGLELRALEAEAEAVDGLGVHCVPATAQAAAGAELVVALGGDGTLLRAAELAHPAGAALLGVNVGHVGFLAEAERSNLESTVERIVAGSYEVEERLTLAAAFHRGDAVVAREWALNDASVEKAARHRMVDLLVEVDGRPLSRWSGDGVVCATPTGSTAYAFSAGGPVVWPSVQAMLIVPISAHALFARPLVVSPSSVVELRLPAGGEGAIAFFDGRRTVELEPGDRVVITRGERPVRLARLSGATFADRLVGKFHLPVSGWRAHPPED